MKKEFVPYKQALALKELGFDEDCFGYYKPNGELDYIENHILKDFPYLAKNSEWQDLVAAPLYQQAFRWFREKYVLLGFIEPANGYEDKSLFAFYICDDEQNIVDDSHSYSKDSSLHFKTYEEAELACLKKLIEIVKNK
jgi:hypothetical protein